MSDKNFINRTNRTILFEEINPEKMDILTLINDSKNMDSLDDENIIEINRHLLVSSFDEFLEKFDPKVYSYFLASIKVLSILKNVLPLLIFISVIKSSEIPSGFFKIYLIL